MKEKIARKMEKEILEKQVIETKKPKLKMMKDEKVKEKTAESEIIAKKPKIEKMKHEKEKLEKVETKTKEKTKDEITGGSKTGPRMSELPEKLYKKEKSMDQFQQKNEDRIKKSRINLLKI